MPPPSSPSPPEVTPVNLTDQFITAIAFALEHHRHQRRKLPDVPYASHLLAVAAIVIEDGGSEAAAIAGLLHDTIEDCGVTAEELRSQFGARVADIVVACTECGDTWINRKRYYLDRIAELDPDGLRVSLADKLHNLRSLCHHLDRDGHRVWQYFGAPPAQIKQFYSDALEIYRQTFTSIAFQEFERYVIQLGSV